MVAIDYVLYLFQWVIAASVRSWTTCTKFAFDSTRNFCGFHWVMVCLTIKSAIKSRALVVTCKRLRLSNWRFPVFVRLTKRYESLNEENERFNIKYTIWLRYLFGNFVANLSSLKHLLLKNTVSYINFFQNLLLYITKVFLFWSTATKKLNRNIIYSKTNEIKFQLLILLCLLILSYDIKIIKLECMLLISSVCFVIYRVSILLQFYVIRKPL